MCIQKQVFSNPIEPRKENIITRASSAVLR